VSNTPIRVVIERPDVVTLTLVDLPGIIHTDPDEQEGVVAAIRAMILERIRNPGTIILCVLPATQDIENNFALALAKDVDPKRERTLGVITKVDLVGTAAKVYGEGGPRPAINLKLGYIPVRNRDPSELRSGVALEAALATEREFFARNHRWGIAYPEHGTAALASTLHTLLRERVSEWLPRVIDTLGCLIQGCRSELHALPPVLDSEIAAHRMYMTEADRLLDLLQGHLVYARCSVCFHPCLTCSPDWSIVENGS
jgi:dynamin 1-like protein